MKDKVFIAWSGSNKVAMEVKKILEEQYNYICSIGGNADNSSSFASVGDTVIQQIKNCNQAIVIFQNRKDGAISNNLFFELGYVFSLYGIKKVHCVKKSDEEVILPSDFDNSFVESIDDKDENGNGIFAEGIVRYFMSRQKMSVLENKMFLINNRYIIHDKISSHYSEYGSKCSDYELAQYILFYMQAGHMFGDESKIEKEIAEFKNRHNYEFSSELNTSVNLCLSYYELVKNIKVYEDTKDVYIDQETFWKTKKDYKYYASNIVDDDIGVFDEWANVFIDQHLQFLHMLFANNVSLDESMRKKLYKKCCELSDKCEEDIEKLRKSLPYNENHDETGLLSLLRAYLYRNTFIAKRFLGEEDFLIYLEKTFNERSQLKNLYSKGSIDTKLYNNFSMEYYLCLISYLNYADNFDIDEFEVEMYKMEIKEYIKSVKSEEKQNIYLDQIAYWYKNH